ncbi:MAG TPA: hypothetical protein VGG64_22325 [Pirellulales bacterium]|jgi:hypothetical protein
MTAINMNNVPSPNWNQRRRIGGIVDMRAIVPLTGIPIPANETTSVAIATEVALFRQRAARRMGQSNFERPGMSIAAHGRQSSEYERGVNKKTAG